MAEYDPSLIEEKWQNYWDSHETFKTQKRESAQREYVLDMFPYPSGSGLHVGHPLGYTATDIYSRYKRMKGVDVLHPMGFDAFGLPAEQHAVRTGEHPGVITHKNCDHFISQLKRLGFSYDWSREVRTCDPEYYRWTQWIFIELFESWFNPETKRAESIETLPIPEHIKEAGSIAIARYQEEFRLAYYSEALVNWCPALGTVLANEEVIDGLSERGGHPVERRPMKQWMLRITAYADRLIDELTEVNWPKAIKEQQRNWIGKKHGADIDFVVVGAPTTTLTAFTTRPDTIFGTTYVVISPEHHLIEQLTTAQQRAEVSEYVKKATLKSELERTIEGKVKTGVFTGSYVLHPFTGEHLPLYVADYVLITVGTGVVMGVPGHDDRDFDFASTYKLPIVRVLGCPKGTDNDHSAWTAPGVMLPVHLEEFREIEGIPNTEAMTLVIKWLEERGIGKAVVNYKLRDWLFSRQRYWGEPIPIVHWENGTITAVRRETLPLELPNVEDYKPSDTGESPLAKVPEWLEVVCPETGMLGRRETNTMPQWAGSCWYYLRFTDPKNDTEPWSLKAEKDWCPVDLYVGGAEHAVLHLLYARFWHKVLFDKGLVHTKEPFQRLYNQGMIVSSAFRSQRGAVIPVDEVQETEPGVFTHTPTGEKVQKITAKMSKSLKNVVDPIEVIEELGADTLRLYLMFMGPLDQMRPWDSQAISGSHRFLKRVYTWVQQNLSETIPLDEEAIEVKKALHHCISKVSKDMDLLGYNTAISSMMECLNQLSSASISRDTLESFVLLLSPFAPHLAEELWQSLGKSGSISGQPWPRYDEQYLVKDAVEVVIQVNGKKRASVKVSPSINEESLRDEVAAELDETQYKLLGTEKVIIVWNKKDKTPRLVNIVKK